MSEPADVRELPASYKIRAAQETDLPAVVHLLTPYVEQELLLRRTEAETLALIATAFVVEHQPDIENQTSLVGFCAVEIYSKKLSEIQCLAVAEGHQGHGIGAVLVQQCVDLARRRGVMEVMAISASEDFLRNMGFDYSLPKQKRALFFQLRDRRDFEDLSS